MKKEAPEKQEGEIANTGICRGLVIYRSCRTQLRDSRIPADERQTGSFSVTKNRWLWVLFAFVISALILVCAFHFDPLIQRWIAEHQNRGVKIFMTNVSRFGDWPAHAAVGLICLGIAYWYGSKKWTRVFAAMLLACTIAGASTRIIKITTGRARPSVKTETAWAGPRLSSEYHAFPSGHTAASSAFFTTLFFASWRLGLACAAIPALIAISRMYVAAHYLSDVVFASMLGVLCALLAARWLQVGNHRALAET
jgi:undecaprenyl-diphosphatase